MRPYKTPPLGRCFSLGVIDARFIKFCAKSRFWGDIIFTNNTIRISYFYNFFYGLYLVLRFYDKATSIKV